MREPRAIDDKEDDGISIVNATQRPRSQTSV